MPAALSKEGCRDTQHRRALSCEDFPVILSVTSQHASGVHILDRSDVLPRGSRSKDKACYSTEAATLGVQAVKKYSLFMALVAIQSLDCFCSRQRSCVEQRFGKWLGSVSKAEF